jgi:hypothetical protein
MNYRDVIDKLKSNFLLRKFKKNVSESEIISDLESICNLEYSFFMTENEIINEKFDNIRNYIVRKNVINEINSLLNDYYRWFKINENFVKISAKQILSAWLITYCSDIVLGDIDCDEKKYVKIYAQSIIKNLMEIKNNDNNFNIIQFNRNILFYTDYITLFLERDKLEKINHYTAEWISLEKSYNLIEKSKKYNDEQKDIILKNILKDKNLIEKNIKLFMKNFDFERLKKIINISQNLSKKIIDNYKLIIHKDISEKKYDVIHKILIDIKSFIIVFNRKQKHKLDELNEKFDEEYLINLLKNDVIHINDVKLFGDFVIQYICDIGSVECEIESKEKWNKIKENNNDTNILISDMFIFMIELIEIIKNELLDYEYLLKNIYYSL